MIFFFFKLTFHKIDESSLLFFPLAFLQEVMELRNQISQSGVQVDVDAPKGHDLSQIMEGIRANYEKIALKNAEDLKRWHENQVINTRKKI